MRDKTSDVVLLANLSKIFSVKILVVTEGKNI